MSVENAKSFVKKLNSDESFLNQIAGAGSDEARLQIAGEAGFEFSAEELAGVVDQLTSEELSEEELDTVAGGAAYIKFDGVDGESFKKLSNKYTEVEWTYHTR